MEEDRFKDVFLDLKINECIKGFRKRYEKEYKCLKKFNEFLYKIQDELTKNDVTQQNTFIMASLSQLQKLYNSSILMFERGLVESGNVLIRTILELSFKIIEVIKNEDFVDDLLLDAEYETLALLNDIERNKVFEIVPEDQVKAFKGVVNNKIKDKKRPKTKTKYLVDKNKLQKEYILYRLQCDYVHQAAGVIGKIIKITPEGLCFIDGDLQLKDFKKFIGWLFSITTISIAVLLKDYIKNKELIEEYNKIMEEFEGCFKDLV